MAIHVEREGPDTHLVRIPSLADRAFVVTTLVGLLGGLSALGWYLVAEAFSKEVASPRRFPDRPITTLLFVLFVDALLVETLRSPAAKYCWNLLTGGPTTRFWRALTIRSGGAVCVYAVPGRSGRLFQRPLVEADRELGFGRLTFTDEDQSVALYMGRADQALVLAELHRQGLRDPAPARAIDPNVRVTDPAQPIVRWLPVIFAAIAVVQALASFEWEPYSRERVSLRGGAAKALSLWVVVVSAEALFQARMRWFARVWTVESGVVRTSLGGWFERSFRPERIGVVRSWRGHHAVALERGREQTLFTGSNPRRAEGVGRWLAREAGVPFEKEVVSFSEPTEPTPLNIDTNSQ